MHNRQLMFLAGSFRPPRHQSRREAGGGKVLVAGQRGPVIKSRDGEIQLFRQRRDSLGNVAAADQPEGKRLPAGGRRPHRLEEMIQAGARLPRGERGKSVV